MAKLAVLISRPNSPTKQISSPAPPFPDSVPFPGDFAGASGPRQGRRLDCRIPRSRASCSRVRGRNEPVLTVIRMNSSEAHRSTHPLHRRRKPPRLSRMHTSPKSPAYLSESCLRPGSVEAAAGGPPREATEGTRRRLPWVNYTARRTS